MILIILLTATDTISINHSTSSGSNGIGIFGVLFVLILGYFLGMNHKRFINFINQRIVKKKDENIPTREFNEPIIKNEIPKLSINEGELHSEFIAHMDKFAGIYEALYQVSIGKSANRKAVINDWETRIKNLKGSSKIKQFWGELLIMHSSVNENEQNRSIGLFIKHIHDSGISRYSKETIQISSNTRYAYNFLNEEEHEIGKKMKILMPSWSYNNKTIEKGLLTNL